MRTSIIVLSTIITAAFAVPPPAPPTGDGSTSGLTKKPPTDPTETTDSRGDDPTPTDVPGSSDWVSRVWQDGGDDPDDGEGRDERSWEDLRQWIAFWSKDRSTKYKYVGYDTHFVPKSDKCAEENEPCLKPEDCCRGYNYLPMDCVDTGAGFSDFDFGGGHVGVKVCKDRSDPAKGRNYIPTGGQDPRPEFVKDGDN